MKNNHLQFLIQIQNLKLDFFYINLMKILLYILFKCNWVKIISLTSLLQ
jgi:hypothetical protein